MTAIVEDKVFLNSPEAGEALRRTPSMNISIQPTLLGSRFKRSIVFKKKVSRSNFGTQTINSSISNPDIA